ncbi:prolyl oligopeptidase family serine peptidase [Burkholderia sp. Bp8963]|uniref:alpha/beta hydrolase family protein n=1 Tax=Burkholderia sp. Bp8963 TaxID=2184547 RepID=UPI0021AB3036|nr:prolyl oligopeptidase family serine peptidase [Burkholderia sp. Bp8963]
MTTSRRLANWPKLPARVVAGLFAACYAAGTPHAADACVPAANAGVSQLIGPATPEVQSLPWLVWYPTDVPEQPKSEGRTRFAAARDAVPRSGRYPLIVLSHGSGGTPMTHWKTARYFARRGYVVLAIVHRDDNAVDSSGSSTLEVWRARPKQWSAALDALLASHYAQFIDRQRIAAVGFSAGAYTALAVGGARPSSLALDDYCLAHPQSDVLCVQYGPLRRAGVRVERWLDMRQESLDVSKDARVRAVVAMAPPGAALFAATGLRQLDVPTLLLQGDRDDVLKYPNDARYLASVLRERVEYHTVPGGHFVFVSIDPAWLRNTRPDANAEDETAALRTANQLTATFLARALADPKQPDSRSRKCF